MAYPETFDALSEPSPSTIRSSTGGISPANTATSLIRSLQQVEHKLGLAPTAVTFTADAGTDTLTSAAHGLSNADVVTVSSSGTLPGGLAINTYYFVVGATTNTFQLSATRAGSAIDLTSAGSGTHSFIALFSEGKVLLSGTGSTTSSWSSALNLASGSLVFPQSTSIAPTAEGSVGWDTDDNLLKIGTGSGTKTIVDTDSTQTLTNKTLSSPAITGWSGWQDLTGITLSVASGYNAGQKSFVLDASADPRSLISVGNKLKITRGTAAPTQCTDLEAGSSQYANDTTITGITFTDDFTVEAWVKVESYPAAAANILSRYNGTSGWQFQIDSSGRVQLIGRNAGAGNYSRTLSYPALPLGRWIHVAAVLDMSTFTAAGSPIYIDGVSVPVAVDRGGSNPTALIQAGNLELGAENGGTVFWDGKLAEVRLWSAARTATEIRDNMNQAVATNATNLDGYWKLNGDFTDSQTNHTANSLTAQGGAVATNADNPWVDTEYAIVTALSSTQITVFTGTDHNIPNMTLSSPQYSSARAPLNFPASREKWRAVSIYRIDQTIAIGSVDAWFAANTKLTVPIGAWVVSNEGSVEFASSVGGIRSGFIVFIDSTPTNALYNYPRLTRVLSVAAASAAQNSMACNLPATHTSQATYTLYGSIDIATGAESWLVRATQGQVTLACECAYL